MTAITRMKTITEMMTPTMMPTDSSVKRDEFGLIGEAVSRVIPLSPTRDDARVDAVNIRNTITT
jgi:hypothetical protein